MSTPSGYQPPYHSISLLRPYRYRHSSNTFSMSFTLPSYVNVSLSGDDTSTKSPLLTPPITPLSAEDVPFRAADDDNVSLNMRKGKHTFAKDKKQSRQSRPQRGGHAYSSEIPKLNSFENTDLVRSKSMGLVHRTSSVFGLQGSVKTATCLRGGVDGKRVRRWTLPTKSAATRGLTPLRSTVKQATLSSSRESPAMITLRRATTNRSPQRNELTFFPEPKFGNERNGLLSYLVSTFTVTNLADMAAPLFADGKSSRTNSVGSDGAHPTLTYPAATVCTETTVEPNLVHPGHSAQKPSSRRCSARYVAGDSSYEVIWDENDSLTASQGSSRPSVTDRRASLAVMKLEAQLARSDPSTRRPSAESADSSSSAKQKYAQALTPDKLDQIFPRLIHKTGLRDLPKSCTGRKRRDTVCSITVNEPEQQMLVDNDGRKASAFTIDFFPPLSCTTSRRTSMIPSPGDLSQPMSVQGNRASPTSDSPPTKQRARLGSMVGASSHARRRSSAFVDNAWRRESIMKKLDGRSGEHISKKQERDSDTTPLLGFKGKGRASHS